MRCLAMNFMSYFKLGYGKKPKEVQGKITFSGSNFEVGVYFIGE